VCILAVSAPSTQLDVEFDIKILHFYSDTFHSLYASILYTIVLRLPNIYSLYVHAS
jgi:hypothetical protein